MQYQGEFSPEYLAFNANLQEFAAKVANLVALEAGGKIAPPDAYLRIKALWKELKRTKKGLQIETHPADGPNRAAS